MMQHVLTLSGCATEHRLAASASCSLFLSCSDESPSVLTGGTACKMTVSGWWVPKCRSYERPALSLQMTESLWQLTQSSNAPTCHSQFLIDFPVLCSLCKWCLNNRLERLFGLYMFLLWQHGDSTGTIYILKKQHLLHTVGSQLNTCQSKDGKELPLKIIHFWSVLNLQIHRPARVIRYEEILKFLLIHSTSSLVYMVFNLASENSSTVEREVTDRKKSIKTQLA